MLKSLNDIFIEFFIKEALNSTSIAIGSRSKILDMGCGKHSYSIHYQDKVGLLVNTDIYKACNDLSCFCDLRHAPFSDCTFDIVLMCEVIEHISNPSTAISEAYRTLKAGGYLILTWPLVYNLHDMPFDFNRFTEFYAQKLLSDNNFVLQKICRRGDIFSILHTIYGQLFDGFLTLLNRTPVLGYFFSPLSKFIRIGISTSYRLHHHFLNKSKRLNPIDVGEGLKGPIGSLALWSLGYCILAKKR